MPYPASIGYFRILMVWFILLVWAFQPATDIFRNLQDLISSPKPVQANSIQVDASSVKTCHHHPEGCPGDCFCPDMHGLEDSLPASESKSLGKLFEPSLVQCTEKGSGQISHSGEIFLPEFPTSFALLVMQAELVTSLGDNRPRPPHLDPALKVPIS
jgi:hypothetical protein